MAEIEAQAQTGTPVDPLRSFRFHVEVQGLGEGRFTSMQGLGMKIDAILYREAGADVNPRFVPGQTVYSEVTLSYGLILGSANRMWDWLMAAAEGNVDRRRVTIAMRDPTGADEVLSWDLMRSWPSSWSASPLDVASKSLAIESMTLVYEGIERDTTSAEAESAPPGAPGT